MTSPALDSTARSASPFGGTTPLGSLFMRLREFFMVSGNTRQPVAEDRHQLAAADHLRVVDTGSWV